MTRVSEKLLLGDQVDIRESSALQVLNFLPVKSERVIKCRMTDSQHMIYANLVEEFRKLDQSGEKCFSSRLMQLRQVANHPLLHRRLYRNNTIDEIARVLCTEVSESSLH